MLEHTAPPRATGRLDESGRVESDAVVFGGGVVDYAAAVHATNPFLDRGTDAAADAVADLLESDTDAALAHL